MKGIILTILVLVTVSSCSPLISSPSTGNNSSIPEVVSCSPVQGATQVGINGIIQITFSKDMNPETLNQSTVLLSAGSYNLGGTINYASKTVTFTPLNLLE